MRKINWQELIKDTLALLTGSAVYAVSVASFSAPNEIAPGGLTGIATVINHLTGWPIGTTMLLLNIPIFVLGAKKLGFRFLTKTLVATVLVSVFIDLFALFIPVYVGDRLLATIYGGVLSGGGLALVFLRGGTTGGADILAKLIHLKYPMLSLGRVFLILDLLVIALATVAFQNFESGLYAVIFIFASSRVIDSMLYGAEQGKVLLVVTNHSEQMANEIFAQLRRGVTFLKAAGGYTNEEKQVLLCAVRRAEAAKLLAVAKSVDTEAFIIVAEAGEILGEGFKPWV